MQGLSESGFSERIPWLLAIFALLVTVLPIWQSLSIAPNHFGAPAFALALITVMLTAGNFLLSKRQTTNPVVNFGVILILSHLAVVMGLWFTVTPISLVNTFGATRGINLLEERLFWELGAAGVALYSIQRMKSFRQRSIVLGSLVAGVTYSGIVGIFQHFVQLDLTHLLLPPSFVDLRAGQTSMNEWRAGGLRAFGTYAGFGEFSATCASAVPLAVHYSRYSASRSVKALSLIATGILLVAVPAGIARSGIIALVIALLTYSLAFRLRQFGYALIVFAIAIIAFLYLLPGSANALINTITNSESDSSVWARVGQYSLIDDIIQTRPLVGLGIGGAPVDKYGAVDSQWLVSFSEGGAVLLLTLILLTIGGLAGFRRGLQNESCEPAKSLIFATGAMYLGILSTFFSFDTLDNLQIGFLFFLIFGLLWSNSSEPLIASSTRNAVAVDDVSRTI